MYYNRNLCFLVANMGFQRETLMNVGIKDTGDIFNDENIKCINKGGN